MIALLMIYALAISALMTLVAVLTDTAFAMRAWPRRGVWIASTLLSIGIPALIAALGATIESSGSPALSALRSDTADARLSIDSQASMALTLREIIPTTLTIDWPVYPKLDLLLTSIWIGMSLSVLGIFAIGWLRLRRSARGWSTEVVHGEPVEVSEHIGPAVFGFLKPRIVVPRWLLTESHQAREAVIAHEREHLAARDSLTLLVGLLAIAAMPWNPLLWWQFRRMRFAVEVDCDSRVLKRDIDVSTYGETLLSIGQRESQIPLGAMALIEPASQLERRIRIMTTETKRFSKVLMLGFLALSVTCIAAAAKLSSSVPTKLAAISASPHLEYVGEQINLRLKDADVRDAIALLTRTRGGEVYLSSKVGGKVTIEFEDTRIDEALDILLRAQHLTRRQEGNRLYIDVDSVSSGLASVSDGDRVNLHLQDVEIRTALRKMAEITGHDIVVGKDVAASVTMDIEDEALEDALDSMVRKYGMTKERRGNIIFIDVGSPAAQLEKSLQSKIAGSEAK